MNTIDTGPWNDGPTASFQPWASEDGNCYGFKAP